MIVPHESKSQRVPGSLRDTRRAGKAGASSAEGGECNGGEAA